MVGWIDFMARICFLVLIVIVAGTDGRSFCWGDDVAGMLSDGGFDFSVGFILGFLSSKSVFGGFEGMAEEKEVCCSPRSKKEFRGTWESLCL